MSWGNGSWGSKAWAGELSARQKISIFLRTTISVVTTRVSQFFAKVSPAPNHGPAPAAPPPAPLLLNVLDDKISIPVPTTEPDANVFNPPTTIPTPPPYPEK